MASEVFFGKCPPRRGFQVAFKRGGALAIREGDDSLDTPWSTITGMRYSPRIVVTQPELQVVREPHIVAPGAALGFKHIDVTESDHGCAERTIPVRLRQPTVDYTVTAFACVFAGRDPPRNDELACQAVAFGIRRRRLASPRGKDSAALKSRPQRRANSANRGQRRPVCRVPCSGG